MADATPCSFVDVRIPLALNIAGRAGTTTAQLVSDLTVGIPPFAMDAVVYGGIRDVARASYRHPSVLEPLLAGLPSWLPRAMRFTIMPIDSAYYGLSAGLYYHGIADPTPTLVSAATTWPANDPYLGYRSIGTVRCETIWTGSFGMARAYLDDDLLEEYSCAATLEQLVSKFIIVCPEQGRGSSSRHTVSVGDISATVYATERLGSPVVSPWYNEQVLVSGGALQETASVRRSWQRWWGFLETRETSDEVAAYTVSDQLEYAAGRDLRGTVSGYWRARTPGLPNEPWAGYYIDETNSLLAGLQLGIPYGDSGTQWLLAVVGSSYIDLREGEVHAIKDDAGRTKLVHVSGDGTSVQYRSIEQPDNVSTWGEPETVYAGAACSCPRIVSFGDGRLGVWYMDGLTQKASYSDDDGRTWAAYGVTMLGSNLQNLYPVQYEGITLGAGVRDGNIYLVRSNDQGATQDAMPDGSTERLVGASATGGRPCLVWYPDGQLVIFDTDEDGEIVAYKQPDHGFGVWEVVA